MRTSTFAIAMAALLSAATAQAVVMPGTVGTKTAYTENFNNGTSFLGGLYVPGNDGFLTVGPFPLSTSASYTFSSAVPIASIGLSFWYSTLGTGAGFTISNTGVSGSLSPTGAPSLRNVLDYVLLNPGPNTASALDAKYSNLFNFATPIGPGSYTLSFVSGSFPNSVKFDDLSMIVTAVPEPSTYALMLAGLGVLGYMARRRKAGSASHALPMGAAA